MIDVCRGTLINISKSRRRYTLVGLPDYLLLDKTCTIRLTYFTSRFSLPSVLKIFATYSRLLRYQEVGFILIIPIFAIKKSKNNFLKINPLPCKYVNMFSYSSQEHVISHLNSLIPIRSKERKITLNFRFNFL